MSAVTDTQRTGLEIAIIGLAGRFPGAADPDAFWQNIRAGVESVTRFDDAQLQAGGVPQALLDDPGYVRAGVQLDGVDRFDAAFFGYSPREAEQLDPQQRLFLECAWEVLEHAGYDPRRYPGCVGVYAGDGPNLYLMRHLLPAFGLGALSNIADLLGLMSGNAVGSLCTRVAYKLDLRGPAVTVQTACSTSLTAVHLACQALLGHDCDLALAGGVWLNLLQEGGYRHQAGAILSPDGHCRAFDARAAGTLIGSGAGIVALKRLEEAERDGDTIHAIIKGSAVNNDGADKVGFTAPSVSGQAGAIAAALALADVPASSLGYVEAHGTGTTLGDPIEVAALTQAFRADTQARGFCALGSVKTNIGHLDVAAGVAGLIKTVLALKHKTLPPSLHFETPNPQIDFAASPFYVNTEARFWPRGATPRRAGVSAFGIGGTNVHVVLEEAPETSVFTLAKPVTEDEVVSVTAENRKGKFIADSGDAAFAPVEPGPASDAHNRSELSSASLDKSREMPSDPALPAQSGRGARAGDTCMTDEVATVTAGEDWEILPLSARSPEALAQAALRLAEHLRAQPGTALANVAFTLQNGRHAFEYRRALVGNRTDLAVAMLEQSAQARPAVDKTPELVFLFPGGGAQYANMGRELYREQPLFREEIDRCCALLREATGLDLLPLLFPEPGDEARADAALGAIVHTQPALFIVEYALARLWMSWGAQPALMLGHSLGEYVAACLAGVFELEDALRIVAARGRLMQSLAPGAMTAVELSEAELAPLPAGCDLAAINGERLCVLSGPLAAIEAAEDVLTARGHQPRRLHVSIASHSALTDPILGELERLIASVPRQAPRIPFVSNVTGQPITAEQAQSPAYWARHLRGTVRFAEGLNVALATPGRALLEVGPGETLSALARQHSLAAGAAGIWPCQAHPQQRERNTRQMAQAVAGLWCAGVVIDWNSQRAGRSGRRVPLPTYPFQRQSYWIEAGAAAPAGTTPDSENGVFFTPDWRRAPLPEHVAAADKPALSGCALVLGDDEALSASIARHWRGRGLNVARVAGGAAFCHHGGNRYALRPDAPEDYQQLLAALSERGPLVAVAHLWTLTGEASLDKGFHSLLALTRALENSANPVRLTVVTRGSEDVTGQEPLYPLNATLFGLCKVIGQEYPHLRCRLIDIADLISEQNLPGLARQISGEIEADSGDALVAYRGPHRWLKRFEPLRLEPAASRLHPQGVYLITGGLGGVGLALARFLARSYQARLILIGRTPLPARELWPELAGDNAQSGERRWLLNQLLELEQAGARVLTLAADVADPALMRVVVERARREFGAIHGVIHAAGLNGSGLLGALTRERAEAVLAPKLAGTDALLAALGDEAPLDFILLCSSIAALAGGLGKGDYAAANAYLDAIAARCRRQRNHPVFSVNWDAWRDLGMAAGMRLPEGIGMTGEQGARAFEAIVNGPELAQIVISTTDMDSRLGPLDHSLFEALTPVATAPGRRSYPRPVLASAFVAPESDLETGLAAIWTELLGIEPVGIDDNLFELGGDSLRAIQILAQVRAVYGVDLHPAGFFKTPTIADLALMVEQRLLDEIENETQGAPA